MSQAGRKIGGAALIVAAAVSLSACSMFRPGDHQAGQSRVEHDNGVNSGGIFGGGHSERDTGGIGVNAYLWRASLDTLAFMPLASADPYGGVIITDWYSNPEKKDERLKATVYILDTRLRADGVSAAVFRETLTNGVWTTATVAP